MGVLDNILAIVLPKGKPKVGGTALTGTYLPLAPQLVLTLPLYRDHQNDIFDDRAAYDSRVLLKTLFKTDPDISAAVHGYLTLADTDFVAYARAIDGTIDPDASLQLQNIILRLTRQVDYSQGYQFKQSIHQLCADFRYMALLRGGI